MDKKKKAPARLSPLECALCTNDKCLNFGLSDQLYNLGLTIRFEDCAQYGGKRRKAEAVKNV